MLHLKLFGGFRLDADVVLSGRAAQRKRQALLAILAAAPGRSISRDRLVALLWEESDAERARHQLASALYDLRQALGEEAILSVGTDLRLNPARVGCDLWEFADALARGERERAVAAYAGPFLEGVHVGEAPEFERWADAQREQWGRAYAQTVEGLAEEREAEGKHAGAVDWWRRLANHEPYSSRVALRLMRALAAAGDPAGAVRHARAHEALVREELGVPADPQVAALAEELSADRPKVAAAARPGREAEPPASPAAATQPGAEVAVAGGAQETGGDAAQDLPFHGITQSRSLPARRRHWTAAAALIGLVAAAAAFVVLRGRNPESAPIRAVAVLPLENFSGDPEQEYLADALTDVLITELARLGQFRVISRTSVMRYKDSDSPLPMIAEELGVDAVVEGSVVQQDGRIRVTAQLIRARTDEHIWAQTYERDLGDILALQGQVSREIAAQIGSELGSAVPGKFPVPRRVEPEAYAAYLRGVYLAGQGDLLGSIESFEQAIELDPANGMAYTGLARNIYFLAFFGGVPAADGFGRVATAAAKALELDASNSEAHGLMALVALHQDWDFAAAERHFQTALAHNPNHAQVRHDYSHFLLAMRRTDEAVAESRRAVVLDPFSPGLVACLGWHYLSDGRYDEASEQALRALGMAPDFFWPHMTLGWVYQQMGRWEEAIAALRQAVALSGGMPFAVAALGHALAASGQNGEASGIAADLQRRSAETYVSAYELAAVYAGLGDADGAVRWLQRAYAERSAGLVHLNWEPRFAKLRHDPRVRELSRKVGLPG